MTESLNATGESKNTPADASPRSKLSSYVAAVLSEPLFHFLILGAMLFGVHAYLQRDNNSNPQRFVVSAGKIEHLASIFSRTWQRPPTRLELEGLIDDYVREEVAYREGMMIGLDEDDTIIRRRIRQKLDFIADDLGSAIEPTEEQLATFLLQNPDMYRIDTRMSFRQVFLDPERHSENLDESVAKLLETLQSDPMADALNLGDQTLLEHQYDDLSEREIVNSLGQQFAEEVIELPLQQWQGPVRSAYGMHVVYIEQRTQGGLPSLDDVRGMVRRDWEQKRRRDLVESFYQALLKKYEVAIEWPDSTAEEP